VTLMFMYSMRIDRSEIDEDRVHACYPAHGLSMVGSVRSQLGIRLNIQGHLIGIERCIRPCFRPLYTKKEN